MVVLYTLEYIEDYAGEPSTDYLNIIAMDRHYKALFKGPVRLLQVRRMESIQIVLAKQRRVFALVLLITRLTVASAVRF
jgi:hypothetical protein